MGNCTYVSHIGTNNGAWWNQNSHCYIGNQGQYNSYVTEITFRTPSLPCYSNSLTFSLLLGYNNTTSLDVRYAITTSNANRGLYANTYSAVSDGYQIASGTVNLSFSQPSSYATFTINTDKVAGGGTYYLYLWATGVDYKFCTIQPIAESSHSIDVTSGHSYSAVSTTGATCTAQGYTTYRCSRCGHEYNGNHTAALGHSYSHNTVGATCTAGGYTTHTCTRCGSSYTDSYTNALGHAEVYGGTSGVHTKCSRCGVTLSTSHSYSSRVQTAATCTSKGTTKYTCACGYSYTSQNIAINPNNHTGSEVKGGTKDVHSKYSCCGVTIKNGSSHSYTTSVAVAATCTSKGTTKYTCSCGYSYTSQNIAALGHNYVGVVTKEPTYTADGVKTYTCSRCKDSYTEVIPKKEGGLVYIDNGTSFVAYQVYIDNGSGWDLYIPYIDNGSSWDMCC